MPSKDKKKRGGSQAKNAPALEKQNAKQYRESQAEYNRQRREYEKQKRASERQREKELRGVLKRSSEIGLYSPKSNELTKYRKYRLSKIQREYADLLDANKTLFVPLPSSNKKKVKERAAGLQMNTTRKGILVPREGHKSASIKYDKKHDEYYIERRGKTKRGTNKGRIYKDHTPLASVDELDRERDRIRRAAKRIKLSGSEVMAFRVSEFGNDGFSQDTFSDVEQLLRYLDKYQKTPAAKINFFRHIRVEKSSSFNQWEVDHPRKEKKAYVSRGKYSTRKSKG